MSATAVTALAVAAAGALGSLARWAMSLWLNKSAPWGTLAVNLTGAFAIGVVVAALDSRGLGGSRWRAVLATGFLGGFTTFSALALETVGLLDKRPAWAAAYVAVTVTGGILLCALGERVVR